MPEPVTSSRPSPISRPRKVSELVVEHLTDLVERGEWPVGSRIPTEPELVDRLGVGRNTVREAVRALEHAGILEPRRGDGTYVRAASGLDAAIGRRARTADALQVLEVRSVLERGAARAAAGRRDVAALAALRAALEAQEAAARDGDEDSFRAADIAFHAELVRAAGNPLLAELYDGIDHVLVRTLATDAHGRHHRDVPGHREVVDAVAAGDAEGAERAVEATMAAVRAYLLARAAEVDA
ncbi:FadR/GntR family transcriptional regulator [Krasilnikoviella flava]|uniref:DNA-binding transcriptional regulator, FadR family n=1 Tax=Krasilnikoviella flava TaxID=526729 RepID=A0A1T5JHN8_9MICO|nr:FCD domain-containing protein [Krasilnikoviella flava]SKC50949.1 DNA-binding transcriptional regulator, FadR family [Krasilnikoviella flava]